MPPTVTPIALGRWAASIGDDRMSDRRQTNRRSGLPLFDPDAFAIWRLVEGFPPRLGAVRTVAARSAPLHDRLDGHLHAVPTVVCCLAGTTRIETARGGVDLAAGEGAVVAPGAWHRHPPLRGKAAIFAQGLVGRRSDVLLATAERRWTLVVPEDPARDLLARMLADTDDQQRRAAMAELVATFARAPAMALTMDAEQAAMARYLWSNFTRPIAASEIWRASGLGRAQAHASFRDCFGEPPKRALTRCRLALAERLLAEGVPPGEAAARSGLGTGARLTRIRRRFRA
jgi:AraC-like DNA-binding protein